MIYGDKLATDSLLTACLKALLTIRLYTLEIIAKYMLDEQGFRELNYAITSDVNFTE